MKFLSFQDIEKKTHYWIEVKAVLDVKEEKTFKFQIRDRYSSLREFANRCVSDFGIKNLPVEFPEKKIDNKGQAFKAARMAQFQKYFEVFLAHTQCVQRGFQPFVAFFREHLVNPNESTLILN